MYLFIGLFLQENANIENQDHVPAHHLLIKEVEFGEIGHAHGNADTEEAHFLGKGDTEADHLIEDTGKDRQIIGDTRPEGYQGIIVYMSLQLIFIIIFNMFKCQNIVKL